MKPPARTLSAMVGPMEKRSLPSAVLVLVGTINAGPAPTDSQPPSRALGDRKKLWVVSPSPVCALALGRDVGLGFDRQDGAGDEAPVVGQREGDDGFDFELVGRAVLVLAAAEIPVVLERDGDAIGKRIDADAGGFFGVKDFLGERRAWRRAAAQAAAGVSAWRPPLAPFAKDRCLARGRKGNVWFWTLIHVSVSGVEGGQAWCI